MRITTQQIFDNLLSGVRQQQKTQAQGTEQISSGYKFTRPGESPLAFRKSVDIRHVQAGIKSSLGGLSTAKLRLGASSSALSQMLPLLQRAQVLAVQQASGALGTTGRQAAEVELTRLQSQLLALSNQKFEGGSLFAGTATNQAAFSNAFNAGAGTYAQDMNTSMTSVTQTANPNAVNGTYTMTLDASGTHMTSIKNGAGTELLATPVTLASGTNTFSLSNGVTLSANFTGPAQTNTKGGVLTVTGANVAGHIHYTGDTRNRKVAVTSTQTVISNVRGDRPAFTQAFASIKALETALATNNVPGIKTALGQLNAAGNAMTELTAEVGGRLASVALREQVFQSLQTQTEQRLGQLENTDIAAVVTRLSRSQVALQATFSEISRIGNLSLVRFLK